MAIDRTQMIVDGGGGEPAYNPIVAPEQYNIKNPVTPGKLPTTSVGGFRTIDYSAAKAAPNEKASLESRVAVSRFVDNLKGNEQSFYQSVINTVGGLQNLTQNQLDTLFTGMQKDMRDSNTNVGNRTQVTANGVNNWISNNLSGTGVKSTGSGNNVGGSGGGGNGGNLDLNNTGAGGNAESAYYDWLKNREVTMEADVKAARIGSATEQLRVFLKQLFLDTEDAFVEDAIRAARPDFELGLDPEVILKKMEDYDNPNSLFAKRFAGNVALRKQGIEPLSPEVYLQQERTYREYLDAVGLGDIGTRNTFAELVGKRIAPTELARRITNVFDVWDSADTPYKNELELTLGLTGESARNEVAKVLLLGKDAAAELQKKVATAGVATEARVRGLDVGSAQQLGAMGITREQARTGFEQIALTAPRMGTLSEIYDKKSVDTLQTQQELEREQFQGMQSQRRRRLAEQETAAFMGQSGTAGAQSLGRRRAGSI
jgi:hypothetical protein